MQDAHIDLDKIILILEEEIKTVAVVSYCQNTQSRGTLKYQILSLLCKDRAGANLRPLARVLQNVPSTSPF